MALEEPPNRDRKQQPTPITSRSAPLGLVPTEVRAGFGFLSDLGDLPDNYVANGLLCHNKVLK